MVKRGFDNLQDQITGLGVNRVSVTAGVQDFGAYVEREKIGFHDKVQKQNEDDRQRMEALFEGCKVKFSEMEASVRALGSGHQSLFQETKIHVDRLIDRVVALESSGSRSAGGGGSASAAPPADPWSAAATAAATTGGMPSGAQGKEWGEKEDRHRGFLPDKKTIPNDFSGENLVEWRSWTEDMEDYLDDKVPGMRACLKAAVAEEGAANHEWLKARTGLGAKVMASSVDLWRALKNLTTGEAKTIVKSVREHDGFLAWQKLSERYEQGREARTGMALAELGDLVKKPAKKNEKQRPSSLSSTEELRKWRSSENQWQSPMPKLYSLGFWIRRPEPKQHCCKAGRARTRIRS